MILCALVKMTTTQSVNAKHEGWTLLV